MAIFHHQDGNEPNVDYLSVTDERTYLLFDGQGPGDGLGDVSTRVRVDRDAVLRLHAALGEWLYPVHTPEAPNRSLIEQMIDRAVENKVAAVLPLHLSQGGAIRISGPCKGHVDAERDHDPEPGDVGHPRPAVSPCGLCGHEGNGHEDDCVYGRPEPQLCKGCSKGNHPHTFADCAHCDCKWTKSEPFVPFTSCTCHDADGNSVVAQEHGRLMAELPRRARPRTTTANCADCGHGWAEHYSSFCWAGEDPEGCRCTRERPASAPVPEYCGECTHSWARHGVGAGPCNVRIPGGECGCERLRP